MTFIEQEFGILKQQEEYEKRVAGEVYLKCAGEEGRENISQLVNSQKHRQNQYEYLVYLLILVMHKETLNFQNKFSIFSCSGSLILCGMNMYVLFLTSDIFWLQRQK